MLHAATAPFRSLWIQRLLRQEGNRGRDFKHVWVSKAARTRSCRATEPVGGDFLGVVHVNFTEHPTSAWTGQQLVKAFPEDSAPRWLLRDRDSIYDDPVRRRIASLGITEVGRQLACAASGQIILSPEVGGLHHRYDLQAA